MENTTLEQALKKSHLMGMLCSHLKVVSSDLSENVLTVRTQQGRFLHKSGQKHD